MELIVNFGHFQKAWDEFNKEQVTCHEAEDVLRSVWRMTRMKEEDGLLADTRYVHEVWELLFGAITPSIGQRQTLGLFFAIVGKTAFLKKQFALQGGQEQRRIGR